MGMDQSANVRIPEQALKAAEKNKSLQPVVVGLGEVRDKPFFVECFFMSILKTMPRVT